MLKKILGENIRQIRMQKGLSQKEAASLAGFSPSYWGYLERGQKNPSVEVIEKIAGSLGAEAHLLFINPYDNSLPAGFLQLMHLIKNMGDKHVEFFSAMLKAYIKTNK